MKLIEDERQINIINEDMEDQEELIRDLEDFYKANPTNKQSGLDLAFGIADIRIESRNRLSETVPVLVHMDGEITELLLEPNASSKKL